MNIESPDHRAFLDDWVRKSWSEATCVQYLRILQHFDASPHATPERATFAAARKFLRDEGKRSFSAYEYAWGR